jgi:hypothetical protein
VDFIFPRHRRKEDWQKKIEAGTTPNGNSGDRRRDSAEIPTNTAPIVSQKPSGLSTIDEIMASEVCPNTFHVKARVVGFYPLRLESCVILHCTKCKKE